MKEEIQKELIKGVCIAIDLLNIDVEKEFPNLYKELKKETENDTRRIKNN